MFPPKKTFFPAAAAAILLLSLGVATGSGPEDAAIPPDFDIDASISPLSQEVKDFVDKRVRGRVNPSLAVAVYDKGETDFYVQVRK